MPKIKGGRVKSIGGLKKSLKRGGGQGFLARVPKDGSITVRFLEEPTEWVEFWEFYDEETKSFYPMSDDGPQPSPDAQYKPSKRYLANAVNVDDNKVIALAMPVTLAKIVLNKYEKFDTLLDRDYELTREGDRTDTTYDATPEAPTKMNLKKFEPLDLMEELAKQLPTETDTDDDDDDDWKEKPSKSSRTRTRPDRPKSGKDLKAKPKGMKKKR